MTTATRRRRTPLGLFADKPVPRLYDRIVEVLRVRHYSLRTEEPTCTGFAAISSFISVGIRVNTSKPLDRIEGVVRANRPKRLPTVLTRDEARFILGAMFPRQFPPRPGV